MTFLYLNAPTYVTKRKPIPKLLNERLLKAEFSGGLLLLNTTIGTEENYLNI